MKTLAFTVLCGHFEAYTAQNHCNLQGFVPGRRTNPCKYRRFVPFRSLQTPKKPFRQNLSRFLAIFRPFLKPRHFKNHRFLRCFWPDSHRKPCKLRPLLQTGGADNTGIYSVLYLLAKTRARLELKGGGRPPPRPRFLSEMGVHSGYNSFLLKQKENSGSVTATFRDQDCRPVNAWTTLLQQNQTSTVLK